MTVIAHVIQNEVFFPKSAAARSAALLVLEAYPYVVANDLQRFPKAIFFPEPEVFAQTWRSMPAVTLFLPPPAPPVPADIFVGEDTFTGWPVEAFEPPTFPQSWKYNAVILNKFTPYNPATDVRRRPQATVFSDPETFAQSWKTSVTILNGRASYIAANDFRSRQAKVFTDPEVFAKPWLFNQILLNSAPPYNPVTDVTRLKPPAKFFTDFEVFSQAQKGSYVVRNVAPAAPYTPLDVAMIGMRIRPGGYVQMNIRPNQNYPL